LARPKKVIDENLVKKLAAIHCTMEEIGLIVGCSVDTLERRFADIIKLGKSEGKMSLRRKQYELAVNGNTALLIWLGKQLLGQRENFPEESTQQPIIPSVYKLHVANKPDSEAG
jgi:hypothetical protein